MPSSGLQAADRHTACCPLPASHRHQRGATAASESSLNSRRKAADPPLSVHPTGASRRNPPPRQPPSPQPPPQTLSPRLLLQQARLVAAASALLFLFFACSGHCVGPPHSRGSPWRLSRLPPLFPREDPALSGLEVFVGDNPALNLEETEDCLFTGTVPDNIKNPTNSVEITPTQWAEHVLNNVYVQDTLKAYQTLTDPGSERQFMLSFKLPENLAASGEATLTLRKDWDGISHGWGCSGHVLVVTRLSDDKYLQGRNASSETQDVVQWQIASTLTTYSTSISSLVFGKGLEGQSLHLLFREKSQGCLSSFKNPKDSEGPKIKVTTSSSKAVAAVYGNWEPYSSCRVSCVSRVNYQCRKRSCTPGQNDGTPCQMELMVDKQPCADAHVTAQCTCQIFQEEAACPALATCDDSVANNVSCRCSGHFSRASVKDKTVCELGSDADESILSAVLDESSNGPVIALYIILGLFGLVLVVGCSLFFCVKQKTIRDEDLLNANIPPPQGAQGPGMPPDMTASMFWGQAPTVPMGGPQMMRPQNLAPAAPLGARGASFGSPRGSYQGPPAMPPGAYPR